MSVKLTLRKEELGKQLFQDFIELINADIKAALPEITKAIQVRIESDIYQHETTREMLNPNSKLVGVLGVNTATKRVGDVVKAIVNSLYVSFKPFKVMSIKSVRGALDIGILSQDLTEIRNLPSATIVSDNGSFSWVEMSLAGDKIWGIKEGLTWLWQPSRTLKNSRTGHSLIIDKKARAIRIPPEHAGTTGDSWLRRAIDTEDFYTFIEDTIFRYIQ
jgi:hypothetical protein